MVFDPLKFVEEIVVICVVLVALALIWQYRARVLLSLTGDDKLHGNCLDCLWFGIFQCCGRCTGEWTRCLTVCPCFPPKWRRKNLVKAFGQLLGFNSHNVELKNIVVGDLPFDGRGDFYLSVSCSSNPDMVTSLAEEKLPKVVHFPEILTLKLRNSPLEGSVCITIKELNVLGSQELCQVHINPMSILHWSWDANEKMKRFEMKTLDISIERETPPWILLEFDEPQEVREIENLRDADIVRTATKDNRYEEVDLKTYKQQYALLDPSGHAMDEPMEEDLSEIRQLRSCAAWCFACWNCWTTLLVIAYIGFRMYVWSCYRRFSWLTMARLNKGQSDITFPISFPDMENIGQQCQAEVEGTGLEGVPCNPNVTQVDEICNEPDNGGTFFQTTQQPWPRAFSGYQWLEDITGNNQVGIKCFHGLCDFRTELVKWEFSLIFLCVFLVLSNCGVRFCCNSWIRQRRASKQRQRHDEFQTLKKETRERTSGRGLFG